VITRSQYGGPSDHTDHHQRCDHHPCSELCVISLAQKLWKNLITDHRDDHQEDNGIPSRGAQCDTLHSVQHQTFNPITGQEEPDFFLADGKLII